MQRTGPLHPSKKGRFIPRRLGIALLLGLTPLGADDWPQFRGPNGSGVSEAAGLPIEFGAQKNLVWKASVPMGKSSPVLAGERLFLTAHDGDQRSVLCLDRRTGRELWRRDVTAPRAEHRHKLNDAAAPTPVSDGRNIYAFFADYGLVSYGPRGEKRWEAPLGPFESDQGMSASPILVDGKIILVADQNEHSYIGAFDARNGELLWKTPRNNASGAYSTPIVDSSRDALEIVVSGQRELAGYSTSGERLWWVQGLAKLSKGSPVVADGVVYVNVKGIGEFVPPFEKAAKGLDTNQDGRVTVSEAPNRRSRRSREQMDLNRDGVVSADEYRTSIESDAAAGAVWAIRTGGRGDVTASHVLWKYAKSLPNVPSPLFYRGVVYLVRNGGIMTSLNPETGEVYKRDRLPDAIEHYYASPVAADGKVYVASETGKITVLEAQPQWEILATSDLGEECYATPALAGKHVYLRTSKALYCFAKPD